MKKTILIVMAVIMAVAMSVSAFAEGKTYVLDFSPNGEGGISEDNGLYTLNLATEANPKAIISKIDSKGIEFQFKANGGWDMFTLVAKDKYNESGLNGVGMKFRFDTGVEVTYMLEGQNWGTASAAHAQYRVLHDLPDNAGVFNNDQWHTVTISITNGRLSVMFDGHETILAKEDFDNVGFTAAEYATMLQLIGNGGEAYIGFGYNAATDSIQIKPSVAPKTADYTAVAVLVAAIAGSALVLCKKH